MSDDPSPLGLQVAGLVHVGQPLLRVCLDGRVLGGLLVADLRHRDQPRRDAALVDDRQPWTVLRHDQAGELCVFVRPTERLQPYRLYEVVVDCADPERVAAWWAERFGVAVQSDGETVWLEGGEGPPWALVFAGVPEPKRVKNRVHWDVEGSTAELLDAGATLLRARDDEIGWDVLADVEGNEFCVFACEDNSGV